MKRSVAKSFSLSDYDDSSDASSSTCSTSRTTNDDDDRFSRISVTSSEDNHFYIAPVRRYCFDLTDDNDDDDNDSANDVATTTTPIVTTTNDDFEVSSSSSSIPSPPNIKIAHRRAKKRPKISKPTPKKATTPRKKRTKASSPSQPSTSSSSSSPPSSSSSFIDNQYYNRALAIRNGQDMVRVACNNRSNFDNIELMEWSEAVLLQLCYINEPLDFKLLDWKLTKQIFLYQWRCEVTLPMQEYVGRKETLSNVIIRNHARKVQLGLINYNEMFTARMKERLTINYRLLSEYAIENRRRERICMTNNKLKWH